MMEKAEDEDLFTKYANIWICGYQSHKTKKNIRLIRFVLNNSHMEEDEPQAANGHDCHDGSSDTVDDQKKGGWGKSKTICLHEAAGEKKDRVLQTV